MAARKKIAKKPVRHAARLASGKYSWRGRAVAFSKLPKGEQSHLRSKWASGSKASKPKLTRKELQRIARKAATDWLRRREKKLNVGNDERYQPASAIITEIPLKTIKRARKLQKLARAAYLAQDSRGGGQALKIVDKIREEIGFEVAAAMPQLWWYH